MIEKHNLDKSFGPAGSSAGMLMFFVGIVTVFFSFLGALFIILGAFAGFSKTTTRIDYEKSRIMFSNDIFGIIKTGRWIAIEPGMKIGIRIVRKGWRSVSLSNRELDSVQTDYRVILFGFNNKEIMPILKTNSSETAKTKSEEMANRFRIGLI
jgi:hypothetical protein